MPDCAAHQSRCWLLQQTVSARVTPRAAQVRRSADNAMGYAADELTKQTRDLKEVCAAWCFGCSGEAFWRGVHCVPGLSRELANQTELLQ